MLCSGKDLRFIIDSAFPHPYKATQHCALKVNCGSSCQLVHHRFGFIEHFVVHVVRSEQNYKLFTCLFIHSFIYDFFVDCTILFLHDPATTIQTHQPVNSIEKHLPSAAVFFFFFLPRMPTNLKVTGIIPFQYMT